MTLLSCTYCRFAIRPRASFLSVDYCPRCLAKRHVAVPLRKIENTESPPALAHLNEEPHAALSETLHHDSPINAERRATG